MLRKILNLIRYQKWTDCEHKNREIDSKYFWHCKDCGAMLGDQ